MPDASAGLFTDGACAADCVPILDTGAIIHPVLFVSYRKTIPRAAIEGTTAQRHSAFTVIGLIGVILTESVRPSSNVYGYRVLTGDEREAAGLLQIKQLNPTQVTPAFERRFEPGAHNLQSGLLRYHPLAE